MAVGKNENFDNSVDNRPFFWDEQNERVKIYDWDRSQFERAHHEWLTFADEHHAGKVIVYAKRQDLQPLLQAGYRLEGRIDGYFQGIHAYLLSFFRNGERSQSLHMSAENDILHMSLTKACVVDVPSLPQEYSFHIATGTDVEELAALYRQTFSIYPTPIDQPAYIRDLLEKGTSTFVCCRFEGELICAASAEIDWQLRSAELTDCATNPIHQGKGLLQFLLDKLEQELVRMQVPYLYTLTRAMSIGMNVTAAKLGYQYRGRLLNNCRISTGWEDMNIWVKPLQACSD